MKNKTMALVFTVGLLSLLYGISHSATVEEMESQTVLITNNAMGGMGMGTGILLDSTHVLTCFHLVDKPTDDLMVFTYPLGRVVKAHPEGGNKFNDILILVLESSVPVRHVPVFQLSYALGEPLTVVGNALGGMQWFITKGIVSGFSQGFLLTDALINPGNSGGPWFNAKGEIVGITDWGIGPEPHVHGLSGGVSAQNIMDMLEIRSQQMITQRLISGN